MPGERRVKVGGTMGREVGGDGMVWVGRDRLSCVARTRHFCTPFVRSVATYPRDPEKRLSKRSCVGTLASCIIYQCGERESEREREGVRVCVCVCVVHTHALKHTRAVLINDIAR